MLSVCWADTEAQCIVSYNVENLFRPGASERYGVREYRTKLNHIAKVIACCNEQDLPDMVGLCEVENDSVVRDLSMQFGDYPYRYIHYESPDRRGIDVALLYRKSRWEAVQSRPIRVELDSANTTRDLLYACLVSREDIVRRDADTLHIIVCHLPSQLNGRRASDWKREKAKTVLRNVADSILQIHPRAKIVALGDFNEEKVSNIGLVYLEPVNVTKEVSGTHKYQGRWTMLDKAYVSPNLAERAECRIYAADFMLEEDKKYGGVKPYRTHVFSAAKKGYSDHLPIVISLK